LVRRWGDGRDRDRRAIDLDLYPNEASDLAVVPGELVARHDQTFVTVLDEGVIEESIAILGHRGDNPFEGWEAERLRLSAIVHAGRTEDAEGCDFHGDHLYVCLHRRHLVSVPGAGTTASR
jgi:hypothetical protein